MATNVPNNAQGELNEQELGAIAGGTSDKEETKVPTPPTSQPTSPLRPSERDWINPFEPEPKPKPDPLGPPKVSLD